MTTNQTIDGVPRDDLELVLLHGHSTHESDRAWDRLRALLEAPPRCPVCGYTEQDCREQMDHYLCGSPEPAPANKRAAQPHGEPVAWLNVATGQVTTSAVVVMDWDDENEQVKSLYAEQPAPVAVALPARPRADEEEYERMTDYEKGLLHGGIELWDKIDEAIRLAAKSR